ncbi:SUMO protease [Thraustotheca clavata]|uniref:SUMO protease n=1 Tax=Thraustotheca clavata TaxID=74557 RepID=A0A1V9Y8Y9_9STRA|nr:SUMO protease [Thraustotheca clavata]
MVMVLYHDAQLYDQDLKLFTQNAWLNDAAINFYLTMIYHEMVHGRDDVLLMDPAVVSCMMLQCDDEEDLLDLAHGLQLQFKKMILLPVNDRENFDSQGSHWALLVYHQQTKSYKFYDSSNNHNLQSAREVAQVLDKALGTKSRHIEIECPACPQQRNGVDCGMYVCLIAEWLSIRYATNDQSPVETLENYVSPQKIRHVRKAMPNIVASLITT